MRTYPSWQCGAGAVVILGVWVIGVDQDGKGKPVWIPAYAGMTSATGGLVVIAMVHAHLPVLAMWRWCCRHPGRAGDRR
jgi:hypothetical protein